MPVDKSAHVEEDASMDNGKCQPRIEVAITFHQRDGFAHHFEHASEAAREEKRGAEPPQGAKALARIVELRCEDAGASEGLERFGCGISPAGDEHVAERILELELELPRFSGFRQLHDEAQSCAKLRFGFCESSLADTLARRRFPCADRIAFASGPRQVMRDELIVRARNARSALEVPGDDYMQVAPAALQECSIGSVLDERMPKSVDSVGRNPTTTQQRSGL